jgi:hypothetical protein
MARPSLLAMTGSVVHRGWSAACKRSLSDDSQIATEDKGRAGESGPEDATAAPSMDRTPAGAAIPPRLRLLDLPAFGELRFAIPRPESHLVSRPIAASDECLR